MNAPILTAVGNQMIAVEPDWYTIKVDDHPYYRQISGKGIAAVDLMICHPHRGLFLIELKDYQSPRSEIDGNRLYDALLAKRRGTLLLLDAVDHLQRSKWYYRLLLTIPGGARLLPYRSRVWRYAIDLYREGRIQMIADISTP